MCRVHDDHWRFVSVLTCMLAVFVRAGSYKPYQSSYNRGGGSEESSTKQYYCDICEKQLNGPKPYGAHMCSKAHREMEEYLKT